MNRPAQVQSGLREGWTRIFQPGCVFYLTCAMSLRFSFVERNTHVSLSSQPNPLQAFKQNWNNKFFATCASCTSHARKRSQLGQACFCQCQQTFLRSKGAAIFISAHCKSESLFMSFRDIFLMWHIICKKMHHCHRVPLKESSEACRQLDECEHWVFLSQENHTHEAWLSGVKGSFLSVVQLAFVNCAFSSTYFLHLTVKSTFLFSFWRNVEKNA